MKRDEFTLAEVFSPHSAGRRKIAFTLAEVLITLGIIGVVAALTLPTLIQNHRKSVVETKLQKFYSAINQAIQRAEADYGDRKTWILSAGTIEAQKEWINKYISPYLKIEKIEVKPYHGVEQVNIYLADGGILNINPGSRLDWIFYTSEKCLETHGNWSEGYGICSFPFLYVPESKSDYFGCNYNKGFEPSNPNCESPEDVAAICYGIKASNDTSVMNKTYCTKAIQNNGWKIPDDYPYKVW